MEIINLVTNITRLGIVVTMVNYMLLLSFPLIILNLGSVRLAIFQLSTSVNFSLVP